MPALKALLAQCSGALLVALLLLSGALPRLDALALAFLQGSFAAATCMALRSARWWIPIHVLFLPAVVLVSRLQITPVWFLAGFLTLALIYWSSFRTQVPLYLSNRTTMAAILALLPEKRPARFLDVGSGTGGLLRFLALARPDCTIVGIETAPLPWLISRLLLKGIKNGQALRADFWPHSLAEYDLVYAFLSPVPMERLRNKARAEMKAGSLLVSNSFPVPDLEPDDVLTLNDSRATRLFVYRMNGRRK